MEQFFDEESESEEMEMPTPCTHCKKIFDLNDGYGSDKWYPNIVICEACHREEEKEIERDEEIQELKETISNAEYDIKQAKARLKELGVYTGQGMNIAICGAFGDVGMRVLSALKEQEMEMHIISSENLDGKQPFIRMPIKAQPIINELPKYEEHHKIDCSNGHSYERIEKEEAGILKVNHICKCGKQL
jgi:hypothetical protein